MSHHDKACPPRSLTGRLSPAHDQAMKCPLCRERSARRRCPALGHTICAVCCGTKRQVEIRCPDDCGYLASARQHPPAVLQRRHERDVTLLVPAIEGLSDRQSRLFFMFQSIIVRHPSDPLRPLLDADIAEASGSVARSLETAARGVIYEQVPTSLPGQELATALRAAFEELARELSGARSPLERDAARALRALEEAARRVGPLAGDVRQGFLHLIERLLPPPDSAAPRPGDTGAPPSRGLILP